MKRLLPFQFSRSSAVVAVATITLGLWGCSGCRSKSDAAAKTESTTSEETDRKTLVSDSTVSAPQAGTPQAPTPPPPPSDISQKMTDAPMEKAYMDGVMKVVDLLDQAKAEFDRASTPSTSDSEAAAMITSNQSLVESALSQMEALTPTARFRRGHDKLRNGIQSLQGSLSRVQSALSAQNESDLTSALSSVGSSYKTIGYAQMALGTAMQEYGRELEQAADKASSR